MKWYTGKLPAQTGWLKSLTVVTKDGESEFLLCTNDDVTEEKARGAAASIFGPAVLMDEKFAIEVFRKEDWS